MVASNRLPFTVQRTPKGLERKPSAGGLVSALEPVLRKRGGTWVGWPGLALREDERIERQGQPYRVSPVALTDTEINRYYHGFSNRTLWPLLHSMPERARFDRRDWSSYERVNRRFAEAVAGEVEGAALAWIHDYHLMLAPQEVRRLAPDSKLVFFLHIPFPPFDLFRLLPWDRELLRGLLGCDLVGFHVEGYARNFLDCAARILGARVDREAKLIEFGDRTIRVGVFPIGIEFDDFERSAREAVTEPSGAERVVLGVDRLDYTKGIPERIEAFARLLELHPEHREKVVLLQIAVPSRAQVTEYRELKRYIDELVGRVNGRFASATWSPIRYLYRSFDREALCATYRDADVAMVTPLRDGMNLVAKEFTACRVGEPGVLMLSSLAGAAETMREALVVNPYDVDGTASALHRALSMDETERASRMAALRRRERRDNVEQWVRSLIEAGETGGYPIAPLGDADFAGWLSQFLKRYRLALFLDYDGTLTPLVDHPDQAALSDSMRSAIADLADRGDTDVAVVSGRSLDNVRALVRLPNVIYAGNHGLEVAGPGVGDFLHEDLVHYMDRTEALARSLSELDRDGAWTEMKGPTLTYHYRAVPEAKRAALATRAREEIRAAGFQPRDAHCAVEARPPIGWDKGRAVLHVLRSRYGPSWSEQVRVIYIGDDQTDEDAFRLLAGLSVTFRVGSADESTAATHRLPKVDAVQRLLEWLVRRVRADV